MRVAVITIAILAFIGGCAHLIGGMAGLAAGGVVLTAKIPPQAMEASQISQQKISFILLFASFLLVVNGLVFIVFALGSFMRKRWARILGIIAYSAHILIFLLTAMLTTVSGSLTPWIVGTVGAFASIIILAFAKKAFEEPIKFQTQPSGGFTT